MNKCHVYAWGFESLHPGCTLRYSEQQQKAKNKYISFQSRDDRRTEKFKNKVPFSMSSMLIRVGELESQVHAEGVFKTDISLWKQIKCFPSTLRSKAEEYHQSFEFVFQENSVSQITWLVSFQNDFRAHETKKLAFSNLSGLKSVSEKLYFHEGLVWTELKTKM